MMVLLSDGYTLESWERREQSIGVFEGCRHVIFGNAAIFGRVLLQHTVNFVGHGEPEYLHLRRPEISG
jgi:hypothetical protein